MNHCLEMWRHLKKHLATYLTKKMKVIASCCFLFGFDASGDVTQPLNNALRLCQIKETCHRPERSFDILRCVLFTAVIPNELFLLQSVHSSYLFEGSELRVRPKMMVCTLFMNLKAVWATQMTQICRSLFTLHGSWIVTISQDHMKIHLVRFQVMRLYPNCQWVGPISVLLGAAGS